jgi:hypothetical protein
MSEIAYPTSNIGLTTPEPPNNSRVGSGIAKVAIKACQACHFNPDGTIDLSTAAAANAAAEIHGFALKDASPGETVTLYNDVSVGYGTAVVAGTKYYLSGTVPGCFADAPATGSANPCALGVPDNSAGIATANRKPRLRLRVVWKVT